MIFCHRGNQALTHTTSVSKYKTFWQLKLKCINVLYLGTEGVLSSIGFKWIYEWRLLKSYSVRPKISVADFVSCTKSMTVIEGVSFRSGNSSIGFLWVELTFSLVFWLVGVLRDLFWLRFSLYSYILPLSHNSDTYCVNILDVIMSYIMGRRE